jgi:AraC-like DNA-binding protein
LNAIELIYVLSLAFGLASIFVLFYQIKPQNKRLVVYLSGYLFILGASNLMVVLLGTGLMIRVPWLYKLLMPLSFLAPVWGYWYVKGTLGHLQRLRLKDYLHLVLFGLIIVHYLPFYWMPLNEKRAIVEAVVLNNSEVINLKNGWLFTEAQIFIIRSLHTALYIGLSWVAIKRFLAERKNVLVDRHLKTVLNWLQFYVRLKAFYLFSVLMCYVLLGLKFNNLFFNEVVTQVLFLLTAALVFVLSSYLLLHPKAILSIERPVPVSMNEIEVSLSMQELLDRIRESKWYADTNLTQPLLLDRLGVRASDFSVLLRSEGYSNFNDFLNSIRMQAFIERADTDELARSSIEGLAAACGFRSSSTFYRVFKEKYQCTPKQYLERP